MIAMIDIIDQATLSTLIQAAGLAIIAAIQKSADMKRDKARTETQAKRDAEAKWREDVEHRMQLFEQALAKMDGKINATLRGQLTQMRSDIVHKAHRYLDDLGCASTDEKQAFDAEYQEYAGLCKAYGIENDFVANLHRQVMALPGRDV